MQLFTAGGKPLLTDAVLVVRCPKCIVGIEFRPRISWREGRFVCRDCAHTVLAGTHNRLNAHCIRQSMDVPTTTFATLPPIRRREKVRMLLMLISSFLVLFDFGS